jgi:hypothetical protein
MDPRGQRCRRDDVLHLPAPAQPLLAVGVVEGLLPPPCAVRQAQPLPSQVPLEGWHEATPLGLCWQLLLLLELPHQLSGAVVGAAPLNERRLCGCELGSRVPLGPPPAWRWRERVMLAQLLDEALAVPLVLDAVLLQERAQLHAAEHVGSERGRSDERTGNSHFGRLVQVRNKKVEWRASPTLAAS